MDGARDLTYLRSMALKEFPQLLDSHVNVAKDSWDQAGTQGFARRPWNGCRPSIWMLKEGMASACSVDLESTPFESTNEFLALDSGQACHMEIC